MGSHILPLGRLASYLGMSVLIKGDPDHALMRMFLHLGFNIEAVRKLRGQMRQATDELLDLVQHKAVRRLRQFCVPAPRVRPRRLPEGHKEDRDRVIQWSVDFFNNIPITVETTIDQ